MEVTPQFVNFTSEDHPVKDLICMPSPALNAHVVAFQNLVVVHEANAIKVINDPFIEVVTPVCERVSEHSSGFALPGRTEMSDKFNRK